MESSDGISRGLDLAHVSMILSITLGYMYATWSLLDSAIVPADDVEQSQLSHTLASSVTLTAERVRHDQSTCSVVLRNV